MDILLDIVFIGDVVLQFFQGYIELGFPVTQLPKVARRYLRSWFALDFFAAIPFDNMFAGASWSKPLKLVKTVPPLEFAPLLPGACPTPHGRDVLARFVCSESSVC